MMIHTGNAGVPMGVAVLRRMWRQTCTAVQNATSGVRHSAISRGSNVESRRQSVPNAKGQIEVDDGEGTVGCAGNRYEARVRRCDIFAEMYSTAVQGCQLPVGTCAEDHNHEMN